MTATHLVWSLRPMSSFLQLSKWNNSNQGSNSKTQKKTGFELVLFPSLEKKKYRYTIILLLQVHGVLSSAQVPVRKVLRYKYKRNYQGESRFRICESNLRDLNPPPPYPQLRARANIRFWKCLITLTNNSLGFFLFFVSSIRTPLLVNTRETWTHGNQRNAFEMEGDLKACLLYTSDAADE